jgi:hypothetical protein
LAFVAATPRSLQVQKDLHEIARSVKSSTEYGLEEKREILSTLKEMNVEAKEFDHASASRKHEIKSELQSQLSELKTQMHEETPREFEEDEAAAQRKIDAVGNSLEEVKSEVDALPHAKSHEAKKLIRQLESQYAKLSPSSSRAERKQIAREMRAVVDDLRQYLPQSGEFEEKKVGHRNFEEEERKKQRVLEDIDEAYEQVSDLPSSKRTEARRILEEMRADIHSDMTIHELKLTLQRKMQSLEAISNTHNNKVDQIHQDVKEVERSLESEHLTESAKESVRASLHHIDRQASRYQSADSEEKREIKSDMQREMRNIKRQFEQKDDAEFEEDDE